MSISKPEKPNSPAGPGYKAAVASAVVAGAFSAMVFGALIANHLRGRNDVGPLESPQLDGLRLALMSNPKDEQLKERIRAVDLDLRRAFFGRLQLAEGGAYMLLVGAVALLLTLKWTFSHRQTLPMPAMDAPPPDLDRRTARKSFRSVVAAGAVFGLLGLIGATYRPAPPPAVVPGPIVVADDAPTWPSDEEIRKHWPRFRGPGGSGRVSYDNIPTSWDGKAGRGILWKSPVPLAGHNSPIVWAGRVFLSAADKQKRQVYCFHADSGKLLWTGDVAIAAAGHSLEVMDDTGYAAPTMATDGKRVFAMFANGDVACFDFDGKRIWARDLGVPDNTYGHASSLVVYHDRLLVLYDQAHVSDGKSELLALNAATGKPVWEMARPVAASWITPIIIDMGGRRQLITCSDPWLIAYDPQSGKELWKAKVLGGEMAPSPVFASGLVFAIVPYNKLLAVRAGGQGDVTKSCVAWSARDGLPDINSPVCDDRHVYLADAGLITCYAQKDGKIVFEHELEGSEDAFNASPTLVGDKLYLLDVTGVTFIGRVGEKYEPIARSELHEKTHASPAFVSGRIYIRGDKHLFCIGDKAAK